MDIKKGNAAELEEKELQKVAGGANDDYRYVESYNCPKCRRYYSIRQYCISGQTSWECTSCGRFTIFC